MAIVSANNALIFNGAPNGTPLHKDKMTETSFILHKPGLCAHKPILSLFCAHKLGLCNKNLVYVFFAQTAFYSIQSDKRIEIMRSHERKSDPIRFVPPLEWSDLTLQKRCVEYRMVRHRVNQTV